MKILIQEIRAYQFMELNETARETAKMNCLATEHIPDFFSEDLRETLADKFGLSHLNTYFSLSNCQGDGLCLYGHISASEIFDNDRFKKIALKNIHHRQIKSAESLLHRIDFEHRGRYYHSKSVFIDNCDGDCLTDRQENVINMIVENVKAWYNSFCSEWETYGYRYFHEISDEDMIESCEAGDYWFTEDGQTVNMNKYREII
jgi:hypothetical protein